MSSVSKLAIAVAMLGTVVSGQAITNAAELTSGIDYSAMDKSVRPQDDFWAHVNGTWNKNTKIEGEFTSAGAGLDVFKAAEDNQRKIIEGLSSNLPSDHKSESYKVGAFYKSFMDEAAVEAAGATPIKADLDAIAAISSTAELSKAIARLTVEGVSTPFSIFIDADMKDSTRYVTYIWQGGLTLPDRDYYLVDDNDQFTKAREAMPKYIATLFNLAGVEGGDAKGAAIYDLEKKLAAAQWSAVESRNYENMYNPYTSDDLSGLGSNMDWKAVLEGMKLDGPEIKLFGQESFFQGLDALVTPENLEAWKAYLSYKLIHSMAPYMSKDFVDARFEFAGRTLRGRTEQPARWKRGVRLTNGALGMAIGKEYVARHFPPEAKVRMDGLVENLRKAFKDGITNLEWMTDETREKALYKLSKFNVKIGYPDVWKSYESLAVDAGDLVGNIRRSNAFDYNHEVNKLGKPIDKTEWGMTPQTVNAYYHPMMNEIVFPAAILQAPYFNLEADEAANYGAIGAIIGHEIGHGFDDKGSTFDGDGNMKNWWSDADREKFTERTNMLVAQYDKFEPLPGVFVKGKLTLGENIGDLSGLAMALKAYKISLSGKEGPVMDGYTAEQRFFLSYAQAWRTKRRAEALQEQIASDPHSPAFFRVNGVVANSSAFYKAFDVKEGDKHYMPADKRVKVW